MPRPLTEAIRDRGGKLLLEGERLRAVLIREGVSKNGNRWTRAVLEKIARIADGVPVHFYDFSKRGDGSLASHWEFLRMRLPPALRRLLPERLPGAEIGKVRNPEVTTIEGRAAVVADVDLHENAGWFRGVLEKARALGRSLGLSIHVPPDGQKSKLTPDGYVEPVDVTKIVGFDAVTNPSAGGGFLPVLEALLEAPQMKVIEKLLRFVPEDKRSALGAPDVDSVPALVEGHGDWVKQYLSLLEMNVEDEALVATLEGLARLPDHLVPQPEKPAAKKTEPASRRSTPRDADPAPAPGDAKLEDEVKKINQRLSDLLKAQSASLIRAKVKEANLPGEFPKFAEASLTQILEAEGAITEDRIDAFLADLKKTIGKGQAAAGAGREGERPMVEATFGLDSTEKVIAALDGMLEGVSEVKVGEEKVPAFRSIKQAYQLVTGDMLCEGMAFFARNPRRRTRGLLEGLPEDLDVVRRFLAEAGPFGGGAVLEAITTATFPLLLSDRMHKRLAKEWDRMPLRWRLVASPETVTDFKTWRIEKLGEYGDLPVVNEGADYQEISEGPSEEEITLQIVKHGGLETITWETILNDDTRRVRNAPRKLARAADRTLFKAVFDLLLDNKTIYDNQALAAAAHNNLITTAASAADAIKTMRRQMVMQKDLDNREAGRVQPSLVLCGPQTYPDYYEAVYSDRKPSLANGENQNLPNVIRGDFGLAVAEILYFEDKDPDQVWLVADPDRYEMIVVGFLNGNQTPELIVQDLPKVGSFFNAEKITWKVRHIWKEVVADYRGFQALIPA